MSCKRFVTYDAREGLGNRVRTHLVAHAYALHTGRQLVVDWDVYHAFGARFGDVFQLNGFTEATKWSSSAFAARICSRLSCVRYNHGWLLPGQTVADLPRCTAFMVRFGEAFFPHGLEDDGSVLGPYRDCVASSLVPKPATLQQIEDIKTRLAPLTIGIHVRRGDFCMAFPERVLAIEQYLNAASQIRAVVPAVRFYVASDDHDAVQPLLNSFDCVLQLKPPRGAPQRSIDVFGYDEKSDRDTKTGAQHAIVDCWALSSTYAILGSDYSSFAQLAAFLGRKPLVSPTSHDVDALCNALRDGRLPKNNQPPLGRTPR